MQAQNLEKSPRVWFPGRTVVLRAKDTIYRIFLDILDISMLACVS